VSGLPWVRLETAFPSNPKVLDLVASKSWRAITAYIGGLSYAGAHGTDGFLPDSALPFMHGSKRDAERLVDVGLWIPRQGGWDINGWSEFQPSTQETQDRRSRAKAAAEIRWHKK
jgi:hypothetical protein